MLVVETVAKIRRERAGGKSIKAITRETGLSRNKFGNQHMFDVGIEGISVHHAGQHPRCHQSVLRQAGDQGLIAAVAERRLSGEALPLRSAPVGADHTRIGAGLIEEYKTLGALTHHHLPRLPFAPCLLDVQLSLFLRDETFFYMSACAASADRRCRWSCTKCYRQH